MQLLQIGAAVSLLVLGRFVFLLFADAMRECIWCAPRRRRDGKTRPPWWAAHCLRCRGRREHFRLGAPTTRRVRASLRQAYWEARAQRIARNAIDRPEDRR